MVSRNRGVRAAVGPLGFPSFTGSESMTIDAVSQSTGAERVVDVEASGDGILVVIRDRDAELARVVVPADPLMAVLSDRPEGPQEVGLRVEVRRNEVLLTVGSADAAVGLDDLMDAVAGVIPAA